MRGNLYKRGSEYRLYVGGIPYATTDNSPYKRLSKENCDEIFGVIDVDKLVDDFMLIGKFTSSYIADPTSFKTGFNKAMELNKDKVFTLEDVRKVCSLIFVTLSDGGYITTDEVIQFIQSLQQPKEIEVEIVMGEPIGITDNYTPDTFPKLDEKNQLILKKI